MAYNTFLKKILNFVDVWNARVNLPFFKKILVGPNLNWFQLNHSLITMRALVKGFQPIFLKGWKPQNETDHAFTLESDQILRICHKGINLFEVTKYQICVQLQIVITDLDFSDLNHLAVIEKWFYKAITFIDYVLPFFQEYQFAKAIILQGYLYDHAIIRWICTVRGIEVLAVENTFNKNRMIWDNISGLSVNKNLAKNIFWRYEAIIDKQEAAKYTQKYVKNIKLYKKDEHESPDRIISLLKKTKTIFYIGQVYSDASTLFGINDFHSPISIIKELVDYSIKKKYTLIIKLHPKEIDGYDICHTRYDSLTHRKIQADKTLYTRITESENIVYDYENRFDTYSMINAADICVTINSQAGLESLLFGKRVITCGNAFYDCLSPVYPAKNREHLYYQLEYLLTNTTVDLVMDEIYTFFYIFNEMYCIKKDEKSFIRLFGKVL